MKPVLVGVDGSPQSARALEWALEYAAARDLAVEAVMTVPEAGDSQAMNAQVRAAEETLAAIVDAALDGRPDPPVVSREVVVGDPAVVLVNASEAAEVVVLGSHGNSRTTNPVLGSVSLACIRMGSCPVLVIPSGGR